MTRSTMRKVQETKLSEIITFYLASAAARGVKDKTLRTFEQHFSAISKRLDMEGNPPAAHIKIADLLLLLLDFFEKAQYNEGNRKK